MDIKRDFWGNIREYFREYFRKYFREYFMELKVFRWTQ